MEQVTKSSGGYLGRPIAQNDARQRAADLQIVVMADEARLLASTRRPAVTRHRSIAPNQATVAIEAL
jgi:hypothetical protein